MGPQEEQGPGGSFPPSLNVVNGEGFLVCYRGASSGDISGSSKFFFLTGRGSDSKSYQYCANFVSFRQVRGEFC